MTPEIGSSFWPQASTIESICKEMVYHNLTAAKMIGNYAKINDISGNFISSNNFEFDFSLQRLGIIENENFTVSIVPLSNNILSISSEIDINFEQIGEIIYDSFNIQIDESTIPGDPVIFKLVVDNGQFNEETVIEKIYGEPFLVLEDDSDCFTEYWTEDSDWNLTYEEYFSPYTSITDSPNSNYSNNSLEVINLINSVDLNGISYAEINFDAKWSIESSYDYVQLEVSDDGGNSWVPQCGKFTNIGVETHDYAENEPLYDGYQTDWINESISLIDYLDKEILIRFKLYTDGGLRRDGFYFDNFKIRALSSNLSITDIDNSISKLYPNPVHNIINIQSEKLISKLVVFDMMGKIILTHSDTNIRSVKLPFLKPGIYLVKLHSENFTENHKIIKN